MKNKPSKRKYKKKAKPAPPPPEPLSLKWFTEEDMEKLFGATRPILKRWHALGLPRSQPTGSPFYNEVDVQDFMIKFRKTDL